MKKLVVFVVLAIMCAAPAFAQGPFNDVPTDHWAYDAVNQLQKDGIIIGYPDGTFGGKRAMSRYEFAVAVARILPLLGKGGQPSGLVTNAELQNALSEYAKKSEIPDLSTFATKADVDAIRKLVDEFRDEIAALGVDVDALKRDVQALCARVDALEAEQRRVRFSGDVNVFAIANANTGNPAMSNVVDLDERTITGGANLARTIGVVRDFDLNVTGRINQSTTAVATINYGNYLNYLVAVDDYVDSTRQTTRTESRTVGGLTHPFTDTFFPYYLYIDAGLGKGALTVGRLPLQFTPYTLKKIDVDSYTTILKTDSGNYPVDGIKLAYDFGGVDVTLFAAKNNENDYLVNGLTGQPRSGLYDTRYGLAGVMNQNGGNSVGGLVGLVTQTAGGRVMIGTPWKGNLGATYYQAWAQGAVNRDQARVFGADLTIPFGSLGFAGSWTQSDTIAARNSGATNIDDNNTAWDAKLTAAFGKLGIDAGYKQIDRNFAAAGFWDKIGRWTNPVNVKGPYADFSYPFSNSIKLVLNGEFLNTVDAGVGSLTGIDNIIKAEGGIQWGFSKANTLDFGMQFVQFNPIGTADEGTEKYMTVGWAHQLSPGAAVKIGYQFINWDGGANQIVYGNDYRGSEGVVQFGVSF